jgi:hypothetical protein
MDLQKKKINFYIIQVHPDKLPHRSAKITGFYFSFLNKSIDKAEWIDPAKCSLKLQGVKSQEEGISYVYLYLKKCESA